MPEREKVIKGLECCIAEGSAPECEDCPYALPEDGTCERLDGLFKDILVILKAQEPRVMSLEEAQAALHTERVVWTECEEKNGDKLLYAGLHMDGTDYFTMQDDSVMEETDLDGGMGAELYGKKYRFWTSQPSDELREATPWQ